MRVMYLDSTYVLVYECIKTQSDQQCAPGMEVVVAYSRTQHLPEGAVEHMLTLTTKHCFDADDFERVNTDSE